MQAKKKLTQEELICAFNQYMPKRPVYPPLVPDQEPLENSQTDSDGSDEEQVEPDAQLCVNFHIGTEMTSECATSYAGTSIKSPQEYLQDNIMLDVEDALQKLINLKVKPNDSVEWLAFCLMNMLGTKEQKEPNGDHLQKPNGCQLDFKITGNVAVAHKNHVELLMQAQDFPAAADPSTSSGKRKLPH